MYSLISTHGDPPGPHKKEYVFKHVYSRIRTLDEWKIIHGAFIQKKVAAWPADFSRGSALPEPVTKIIARLAAINCLTSTAQISSKVVAGTKQYMRREYAGIFMPWKYLDPLLDGMAKFPEWAMRATDYSENKNGKEVCSTFGEEDAYFPIMQSRGIRDEEWWEIDWIKLNETPDAIKCFQRFPGLMDIITKQMIYVEIACLKWSLGTKSNTTALDVIIQCVQ